MLNFQITYVRHVLCVQHVLADNSVEALVKLQNHESNADRDLIDLSIKEIKETDDPPYRQCPDCFGTGYEPSTQEYCHPICLKCNCLGEVLDQIS